jgi:hypothetical protein
VRGIASLLGFVLIASGAYRADQLGERGFSGSIEHPAIDYAGRPSHDAVAALAHEIDGERVRPTFDAKSGYLRSILDALHVPVESQMLVFSKTGVQRDLTNPQNPRALFFNDSVAVGYVRGAPLLELAAHDPEQGVVFYTMRQAGNEPARITRRDGCLSCHESYNSLDVPGMLVRSNFTAPDGNILRQLGGSLVIDHRSPFEQRWGGWYVTGTSGTMRHMGNAIVTDPAKPETMISAETLNLTSVERRFDAQGYPSVYSDIVALMVFEHQMHMVNLLTRVGWEVRLATFEHRLNLTNGLLRDAINELVDYMLFIDEPRLPSKIQGLLDSPRNSRRKAPRMARAGHCSNWI